MAATKCPQQAGGGQGKKNNPTGRKGRKRRITTLSTRSMELVKATSEHPNLRKGRQKRADGRTHARTHARTMFLRKDTIVATGQTVKKKRKRKHNTTQKKRKRKTWLKEKVKNWLSNLTRVKSTTLSTCDAFHLLLSVLGQQLPIVANSILPNIFIHITTRSDLQPGRNQGLLTLNQAGGYWLGIG
jgi:hypothetical protein